MSDRRKYIGPAVDAVMTHWMNGFDTEDEDAADALREWWATDECADAALEMVSYVVQAIEDSGHEIRETP